MIVKYSFSNAQLSSIEICGLLAPEDGQSLCLAVNGETVSKLTLSFHDRDYSIYTTVSEISVEDGDYLYLSGVNHVVVVGSQFHYYPEYQHKTLSDVAVRTYDDFYSLFVG